MKQQRDWLGTLAALGTGIAVREESMRCHHLARSLVAELVSHRGPDSGMGIAGAGQAADR